SRGRARRSGRSSRRSRRSTRPRTGGTRRRRRRTRSRHLPLPRAGVPSRSSVRLCRPPSPSRPPWQRARRPRRCRSRGREPGRRPGSQPARRARPAPGRSALRAARTFRGSRRRSPRQHTSRMGDLFSEAAGRRLNASAPLAQRLRPRSLDDFVGQEHVIGPGRALRHAIEQDRVPSMILYGPPGSGKTTLARIVAQTTGAEFEELSAVSATVSNVRDVLARARERLGTSGTRTILFLDEIHRFNKAQQDALLPGVEKGLLTLIGATTENPYFEVNSALLSRTQIYELE